MLACALTVVRAAVSAPGGGGETRRPSGGERQQLVPPYPGATRNMISPSACARICIHPAVLSINRPPTIKQTRGGQKHR